MRGLRQSVLIGQNNQGKPDMHSACLQSVEKAYLPRNVGVLNFKKHTFAKWQMCAVSVRHSKFCAIRRLCHIAFRRTLRKTFEAQRNGV